MRVPGAPSTDITDPKVRARVQAVATRRNNQARKKLEAERERLALFADELPTPDQLPQDTAEQVIERRERIQAAVYIDSCEREIEEVETVRRYRNQLFNMVSEEEYVEVYAGSLECRYPQWAYWTNAITHVKERRDPMPEDAELVLRWLVDWEGQPPTTMELLHYRGDGMTWRQVFDALSWLEQRRYVRGHQIRTCRFTTPHRWEKAEFGSSAPFSATIAGREYFEGEEKRS